MTSNGRNKVPPLKISKGTTNERDTSLNNLVAGGSLFYNTDLSSIQCYEYDIQNVGEKWKDIIINNKDTIEISCNKFVIGGDISLNGVITNDLGDCIQDVSYGTPNDGDILRWNSSNGGFWEAGPGVTQPMLFHPDLSLASLYGDPSPYPAYSQVNDISGQLKGWIQSVKKVLGDLSGDFYIGKKRYIDISGMVSELGANAGGGNNPDYDISSVFYTGSAGATADAINRAKYKKCMTVFRGSTINLDVTDEAKLVFGAGALSPLGNRQNVYSQTHYRLTPSGQSGQMSWGTPPGNPWDTPNQYPHSATAEPFLYRRGHVHFRWRYRRYQTYDDGD